MLSIASRRSEAKRLVAGCLMLFALPFEGVGVGALVWSAWTLLDWREAAGWVPMPAAIVAVDREEHTDSAGGTTYETTSSYRYEYEGRPYTGTRVAIDTGPTTSPLMSRSRRPTASSRPRARSPTTTSASWLARYWMRIHGAVKRSKSANVGRLA
jgi:hypothetical protein